MEDHRRHLTTSYANIDLNSASATEAPNFVFDDQSKHKSIITLFKCPKPWITCLLIKEWLLESFDTPDLIPPGMIRMETQHLHLLDRHLNQGWVLLCNGAVFLDNDKNKPITILAVIIPHDPRIRWFYTLLPIGPLLKRLDHHDAIHIHQSWTHVDKAHTRLYPFLREAFLSAIQIPHAPAFQHAQTLTDCSPSIVDPDTALQRLEQNEFLYYVFKNPAENSLDLSDDRYLLHLHAAEREIASLAHLRCAEYLLVKRYFFRQFWLEVYRSEKKIVDATANGETPIREAASPTPTSSVQGVAKHSDHRRRVRSDRAHARWLEEEYDMRFTHAKMLVIGWSELGLLDEWRYLEWVRAGGMFESIGIIRDEVGGEEEDDDDDELHQILVPPALAARRRELDV